MDQKQFFDPHKPPRGVRGPKCLKIDGTLKPPCRKEDRVQEDTQEFEESEERVKELDMEEDTLQEEIFSEAIQVLGDISDWEVGDYVAVQYNRLWYPGVIFTILDDKFTVSCNGVHRQF